MTWSKRSFIGVILPGDALREIISATTTTTEMAMAMAMANKVSQSDPLPRWITRVPVSARLGTYAVHQKVAALADGKIRYRRCGASVLAVTDVPIEGAECKRYTPRLREGEVLAFLLHGSVERRQKSAGYDPVLRLHAENEATVADATQAIAEQWLQSRGEAHGFIVEDLRSVLYAPIETVRPKDRRRIRQAAIDMQGFLRVTDVSRMVHALYDGIGRGRAWGLGMVLVRRC